jgi:hypothetical protein
VVGGGEVEIGPRKVAFQPAKRLETIPVLARPTVLALADQAAVA